MADRYNGYTNYETWNVALWINNDQGESEYWAERAGEVTDPYDLGEELKAAHEERAEEFIGDRTGTLVDMLNASLGQVNWYEIAEGLIQEQVGQYVYWVAKV